MSNGPAPSSVSNRSCWSGSVRTISPSLRTPTAMLPSSSIANPPNIFFSASPASPPSNSRTRVAKPSSYAMASSWHRCPTAIRGRSTWTRNAAVMVAADAEGPGHDTAEALMLAVRAGRAFDGEGAIPGGALVLTDGGRIVGIEPGSVDPPDGWSLVELPGATLLPGLIDTHVHLCGDSRMGALDRLPGYSDEELTGVIEQALAAQLAAGVTSVRDLGDRRWSALEWRDRIAADGATGSPTIVASGPPITSPAGHCWHMGGEAHDAEDRRCRTAPGAGRDHGAERHDLGGAPGDRGPHAPRWRPSGLRCRRRDRVGQAARDPPGGGHRPGERRAAPGGGTGVGDLGGGAGLWARGAQGSAAGRL